MASRTEWKWKEVQREQIDCLTVAGPTVPPGSLLPEAVDELPNEPNLDL